MVVRTTATHSSSGSSPEIRRAERAVSRAREAGGVSAFASSGTVLSASTAWPTRAAISPAARPRRAARPRAGYGCGRERGRDQIARPREPDHRLRAGALRLGPPPDLGEDVPGGGAGDVQPLADGRAGRERRRVLGDARASSTPTGSVDSSHTTPARMNTPATAVASDELSRQRPARRRAPSPRRVPVRRRSRCEPPRSGPEHRAGRRAPSGGTSPFASEITPRSGEAWSSRLSITRAARSPGRRGTRSRRAPGPRRRLDPELARQLDALQVVDVLPVFARRSACSRCASAASSGVRRGRAAPRPPFRTSRRRSRPRAWCPARAGGTTARRRAAWRELAGSSGGAAGARLSARGRLSCPRRRLGRRDLVFGGARWPRAPDGGSSPLDCVGEGARPPATAPRTHRRRRLRSSR